MTLSDQVSMTLSHQVGTGTESGGLTRDPHFLRNFKVPQPEVRAEEGPRPEHSGE